MHIYSVLRAFYFAYENFEHIFFLFPLLPTGHLAQEIYFSDRDFQTIFLLFTCLPTKKKREIFFRKPSYQRMIALYYES